MVPLCFSSVLKRQSRQLKFTFFWVSFHKAHHLGFFSHKMWAISYNFEYISSLFLVDFVWYNIILFLKRSNDQVQWAPPMPKDPVGRVTHALIKPTFMLYVHAYYTSSSCCISFQWHSNTHPLPKNKMVMFLLP